MTRHEIARLACRLIALYFMLQAIIYVSVQVLFLLSAITQSSWRFPGEMGGLLMSIGPPAVLGGLGLWLWRKADWMGSRLLDEPSSSVVGFEVKIAAHDNHVPTALPQQQPQITRFPLSAEEWTVIGFMVAGILVLVDGIHAFVGVGYTALTDYRTYHRLHFLNGDPIVTAVVKTALGLWLLFGSRAIVGIVRGLRGKYADPSVAEPRQYDS